MKRFGFWSADLPNDKLYKLEEVSSTDYMRLISRATLMAGSPQGLHTLEGRHIGFYADYTTQADEQIELTTGISYVDLEGARRNYESEAAGRSFDQLQFAATQSWNKALGCIEVDGGSDEERTVFYTALYHAMLDPRIYQDVDGRYVGGDGQIWHSNGTFTKRTLFSGWDVFRSEMPLLTVIRPEVVNDLLNSLITMSSAGNSSTPIPDAC